MLFCTLEEDINQCPCFIKENKTCNANGKCSFQENDSIISKKEPKKEKWFEKYYK